MEPDTQSLMGGFDQTQHELSVHDANTAALFTYAAENIETLPYAEPGSAREFRHLAEICANRSLDFLGTLAV